MDLPPTTHRSDILRNVVAFVDVKSSLGNLALAISSRLRSLGADISHTRTPNVTHVVFRKGSDISKAWATKVGAYLVTPAWVKACHTYQCRMSESAFAVYDEEVQNLLRESFDVRHENWVKTDPIQTGVASIIPMRSSFAVPDFLLQRPLRRSPKLAPLTVPPAIRCYFERLQKQRRIAGETSSFSDSGSSHTDSIYNLSPSLGTEFTSLKDADYRNCVRGRLDRSHGPSSADAACDSYLYHSFNLEPTMCSPKSLADTCRGEPQHAHVLSTDHVGHSLAPLDIRTPVGKLTSPVPTVFATLNRRQSLINAKRRLSPNTPITPDLLMNWVQNAHTPRMNRTALHKTIGRKSSYKPPPNMAKRGNRVVKVVLERMAPQSCSNSALSCTNLKDAPSKNRTTESRRAAPNSKNSTLYSPKDHLSSQLVSKNIMDSVAAICEKNLMTRLRKLSANAEVDLDSSVAHGVSSPRRRKPASKNVRRDSRNRFPRPDFSVGDGLCTTRRSGANNLRPTTASPMVNPDAGDATRTLETTPLHIEAITSRNSLDDFDLHSLPRVAIPDNLFVIAFTGLRKDEELTMHAILRSSKLQHYKLAVSIPYLEATVDASRPVNIKKCTHLVTANPFRRTMNLLRGLFCGVKIVTTEWLLRSAEVGVWLREREFTPIGLPRHSRLRLLPTLFSKLGPIYVAPNQNPPRRDFVELLEMGGAQVTNRQLRASLIIGQSKTDVPGVRPTWLFDSIVHAKLLPVTSYSNVQ